MIRKTIIAVLLLLTLGTLAVWVESFRLKRPLIWDGKGEIVLGDFWICLGREAESDADLERFDMTTWDRTTFEEYRAGTTIIRKGDLGDKMYLVLAGELEVSILKGGRKLDIRPMQMGDIFGEIALVTKVRRTADIIATTDTRLLALDSDSLIRLRRFSPYLASHIFLNIAQILGRRLAERN